MNTETVRLHVRVEIREDDTLDTGLTVERWNALSADARREYYRDMWQRLAAWDAGGVSVLTAGAAPVPDLSS